MATLITYRSPSVTASGTTWAQFLAGGFAAQLERMITLNVATLAPTVKAAWTENGGGSSGGLLAAGTYYQVITETNGFGETAAGPEGDQITVTATHIPRITFQTLKTGNTARNVYLGLVGGVTGGPYYLYAGGITTSTYDLATAIVTDSSTASTPPTTNTTGLTLTKLQLLRALKNGNSDQVLKFLRSVINDFNRGDPMTWQDAVTKFRDAHTVFAMMSTLCAEAGVLISQNPGTIGSTATPVGGRTNVRTWS